MRATTIRAAPVTAAPSDKWSAPAFVQLDGACAICGWDVDPRDTRVACSCTVCDKFTLHQDCLDRYRKSKKDTREILNYNHCNFECPMGRGKLSAPACKGRIIKVVPLAVKAPKAVAPVAPPHVARPPQAAQQHHPQHTASLASVRPHHVARPVSLPPPRQGVADLMAPAADVNRFIPGAEFVSQEHKKRHKKRSSASGNAKQPGEVEPALPAPAAAPGTAAPLTSPRKAAMEQQPQPSSASWVTDPARYNAILAQMGGLGDIDEDDMFEEDNVTSPTAEQPLIIGAGSSSSATTEEASTEAPSGQEIEDALKAALASRNPADTTPFFFYVRNVPYWYDPMLASAGEEAVPPPTQPPLMETSPHVLAALLSPSGGAAAAGPLQAAVPAEEVEGQGEEDDDVELADLLALCGVGSG